MENRHQHLRLSGAVNLVLSCFGIFLLFFLSDLLQSCSKGGSPSSQDTTTNNPPQPPPSPQFSYVDTDTLFGDGVNLQPSYYNSGNVTFGFSLMQQYPNIKSVRIEIEPFVSIGLATSWIRQALDAGYKVIVTYHKYTVLGSDQASDLNDAANWWKTNYATLAGAGPFTVNLINEWGSHNLSSNTYALDYNSAISVVRQVYKGWIIIDCPGYGQETSVAAAAVQGTNGTAISDRGIILSAHIYPNGFNQAKNHTFQQSDLDDLVATGHPCIVGEFGNSPSGNVAWAGMVSYARINKWAVLGWAWNGDGGPMNMVTPAWDTTANAASYNPSAYFTTIYSLL
jgi:hypothetical protein